MVLLARLATASVFASLVSLVAVTEGAASSSDYVKGKEVKVKEHFLDAPVSELAYAGAEKNSLFLLSNLGRLWYSSDRGSKLESITERLDPSTSGVTVKKVVVSEANPNDVVVVPRLRQAKPAIYVTRDAGLTWTAVYTPTSVRNVILHPTKEGWALVSWWAGHCDNEVSAGSGKLDSGPCSHVLGFSPDLGRTLTVIAEHVVQFAWAPKEQKGSAGRVYITRHRDASVDQARLTSWMHDVDFGYVRLTRTGEVKRGFTTVVADGNKFLHGDQYMMVAQVKDINAQTVRLLVSDDRGESWRGAVIAGFQELEESWFTVIDTTDDAIMLHVHANSASPNQGTVYISDVTGSSFSQALTNNLRSAQGDVDLDRILSHKGVYIANVAVRGDASTEGELFDSGASAIANHSSSAGRLFFGKHADRVRTVVSFDKGAYWQYLTPPRVDSRGNAVPCVRPSQRKGTADCALHLHGAANLSNFAPYYSTENAVGLIISTGNVGPHLESSEDETNTYLSRDGGRTWTEIHKGAFIYEMGDHGGLIVMADDRKHTKQVVFSWNEGASWFDFDVSEVPFSVDNIVTEPTATSTAFMIFGERSDGTGVAYHLEFAHLNFRECSGVFTAGAQTSDYELWPDFSSLDSDSGEGCILGQQIQYTRRKQEADCFNGELYEKQTTQRVCPCTMQDYACEVGFARGIDDSTCTFNADLMPPARYPDLRV